MSQIESMLSQISYQPASLQNARRLNYAMNYLHIGADVAEEISFLA